MGFNLGEIQETWMKWAMRCLAFASLIFVFSKLNNTDAIMQISAFYYQQGIIPILLLLSAGTFLATINWLLETLKWKFGFYGFQETGFYKLFQFNLSSFSLSYATPGRLGIYPVLSVIFKGVPKGEIWSRKFLLDLSQQISTWIFACLGAFIISMKSGFLIEPLRCVIPIGLLVYLLLFFSQRASRFINKSLSRWINIPQGINFNLRIRILGVSVLRYFVFSLSLLMLISFFQSSSPSIEIYSRIVIYFWVSSFIPRFFLSDLLGRQSVALLLFPKLGTLVLTIIFLQWVFNALLPLLLGFKFSKQLKLI
ncbi:MAG: hypothetical protein ACI91R_001190 [Vicingaceae bacterium]